MLSPAHQNDPEDMEASLPPGLMPERPKTRRTQGAPIISLKRINKTKAFPPGFFASEPTIRPVKINDHRL